MNARYACLKFPLFAVTAPLLATIIGFVIEDYVQYSNIILLYLLGVLVVATHTSTTPALLCALLSFISYNFFFTEPRYSLFMVHQEDIVSAVFFLGMAALTGHQAARLREQVLILQGRSAFSRIQLDLLEHLAGPIDNQQVFTGLNAALSKLPSISYFVVNAGEHDPAGMAGSAVPNAGDLACVREVFAGRPVPPGNSFHYYPITDGADTVAVAGIALDDRATAFAAVLPEILATVLSQISLALGRTRLARDLEKERVEKERELLRSALLTSVSHDLRTPLSAMIGSASSLLELDDSLSTAQKKELQEAILQEASRLDGYIQNLLDMTRLGYGELRLERDWIGIDEILSVILRRIKPLLQGHEIRISIEENIPLLYVHAALIEQAIYNVLENSVNYSPAGSSISIAVTTRDAVMVIDITDAGPGIPPAEKERVFDMFYTLNRRDSHHAGTGLGLAICKGMLGAHGGKVEILDTPGAGGSLLRLSIPLAGAAAVGDELP